MPYSILYFKKHEDECDYKNVPCKYEGCEVTTMRKMIKDHEILCPFRIVQCNYCAFEVKENKLNVSHHLYLKLYFLQSFF